MSNLQQARQNHPIQSSRILSDGLARVLRSYHDVQRIRAPRPGSEAVIEPCHYCKTTNAACGATSRKTGSGCCARCYHPIGNSASIEKTGARGLRKSRDLRSGDIKTP